MIRVWVTGSKGQLGSEIRCMAPQYPGYEFIFTDLEDLDLRDSEAVKRFYQKEQPRVIVNAAAYTAVDQAETETEQASLLNAELPGLLAFLTANSENLLIHLSTDYVFDGKDYVPYKEADTPNPQSFYGKSKLDGENAVLFQSDRSVIIRTSWLYSSFGKNFVKSILQKAKDTGSLQVVYDQVGSPTYARDLANAILILIPRFLGIHDHQVFHYANEGVASWFDFAVAIVEFAGIQCVPHPIETGQYPYIAPRPPYSVLNTSKIRTLGLEIPYWRDSLADCVRQILQNKL